MSQGRKYLEARKLRYFGVEGLSGKLSVRGEKREKGEKRGESQKHIENDACQHGFVSLQGKGSARKTSVL